MSRITLQEVIDERMSAMEKSLPSGTANDLKYCSKKLVLTKNLEEFEEVFEQYRLLENNIVDQGLSREVFKDEIKELKKKYFPKEYFK